MLKITYDAGATFEEMRESVSLHEKRTRNKIKLLAIPTREKMRDIINTNKVRPQAGQPTVLEDNIDVEFFPNKAGWGVGDIEILDKNAKHWRATNYGSSHMVGRRLPVGGFAPGDPKPSSENFRNGRWFKGEGNFSAIVLKPIPAMNYIVKTINFLRREINKIRLEI